MKDIVNLITKPWLSSHGMLLQEISRPRRVEIAEGIMKLPSTNGHIMSIFQKFDMVKSNIGTK